MEKAIFIIGNNMKAWININETMALSKLATPLIVASLVSMGISITDVVMMGWIGTTELAAGAVASDFYSVFYYLATGVVAAIASMISQALGAGRFAVIRNITQQGIIVAMLVSIPGAIAVWNAEFFMSLLGLQAQIIEKAIPYAQMMAIAFVPMVGTMVFHYFLSAHNKTKIILIVTAFALPVNALGNYVFMFGHLGFPEMGLAGAGVSSAIVAIFMLLAMAGYVLLNNQFKHYALTKAIFKNDWSNIGEIFRVGAPIGLSNLGEMGVFLFSTVIMGIIGTEALAAHAVALRFAGVIYAVPLGFAQAATVRIGFAVGSQDLHSRDRIAWNAIKLAAIVGVLYLLFIWLFNQSIASVFLNATSVQQTVMAQAIAFLTVLAIAQPFDCIGTVCAGVLRGAKDTRVPMMLTLLGFWGLGFSVALVLAFLFDYNGLGIWMGLATGSIMFGTFMFLRLRWYWTRREIAVENIAGLQAA
jgi:MATE family multidrug resistance protein